MQHDPQRVADTAAWLHKAADDLRAAEHDLTAQPPLTTDVVFHCQQLIEKALKGFLAWHDLPFRRTHDLVEVGRQVVDIDPTLGILLQRAAPLTEYAWRFRYPGAPADPSRAEAEAALALAREVYDAILSRLPEATRP